METNQNSKCKNRPLSISLSVMQNEKLIFLVTNLTLFIEKKFDYFIVWKSLTNFELFFLFAVVGNANAMVSGTVGLASLLLEAKVLDNRDIVRSLY